MITSDYQDKERNEYLLHDQEPEHQDEEVSQFPRMFFRVTVIALISWGLLANAINGWGLPSASVDCVVDSTFTITDNANKIVLNLQGGLLKTISQIFCSISCDGLFLIGGLLWVKNSKSNRFVYALILVFLTKAFFSVLFKLQTPVGYAWTSPGFPSLTITYNNDNNFFYSATIGMLTVLTREFFKTKQIGLMLYSMFTIILLSCLFTILRTHYVIDILYGVMIGDFYFAVCDYCCSKGSKKQKKSTEELESTTANESYYVQF